MWARKKQLKRRIETLRKCAANLEMLLRTSCSYALEIK